MEESYYEVSMEEALEDAYDMIAMSRNGYYLFDKTAFNWNDIIDEEDELALKKFNELHLDEGIRAVFNHGWVHVSREG